ncbi:MAG: glycosyltransferase family 39 protein [Candidatus Krumholzibacteriia bacterium]
MHRLRDLDNPATQRLALGLVLLASLALRVWYAASVLGDQLTTVPYLDAEEYDRWARALVAGDWGVGQPYWMGPLYPHLLALSYAVFGAGSLAILYGQWALTLVNLVLVHRLARPWLGPRWALLAVILYAGYGPPVFYAGLKLMVTLVTTLLLLIALQARRAADRRSHAAWLQLGLLVGLCGLARGNVLGLLVLLPLTLRRPVAHERVARWRLVGWLWLGAALMILPVTVRNLVVGHDLVLLTSNGGVNLLIGQQARYGGRFGPLLETPQYEFDPSGQTQLENEFGEELRPSTVSRELTRRALDRLIHEPCAMAVHYARKVYRFFSGDELPQIYSWNFWRSQVTALRWFPVPAVALLALGLVGGLLLPADARRLWLVLVGGWFVSLVPFFPTARYRLPIMGLLAIGAAAFAMITVGRWRAGHRRRAGGLALVALLLTLALWPRWARLDPRDEFWHSQLNRAARAALVGDVATIDQAVAAAERLRPGLAETEFRHGGFLERAGDLPRALQAYEEAARRAPEHPFVLYRVGRTLTELGRHREALIWYDRAAAADPAWSYPWHGRGLSLQALGSWTRRRTPGGKRWRAIPGGRGTGATWRPCWPSPDTTTSRARSCRTSCAISPTTCLDGTTWRWPRRATAMEAARQASKGPPRCRDRRPPNRRASPPCAASFSAPSRA